MAISSNWKTLFTCTVLAASAALAKPCVGFDSDFSLYVFGATTDYSLGTQDGWFNPSEHRCFFERPPPGGNCVVDARGGHETDATLLAQI